jgi:hypothetical protein
MKRLLIAALALLALCGATTASAASPIHPGIYKGTWKSTLHHRPHTYRIAIVVDPKVDPGGNVQSLFVGGISLVTTFSRTSESGAVPVRGTTRQIPNITLGSGAPATAPIGPDGTFMLSSHFRANYPGTRTFGEPGVVTVTGKFALLGGRYTLTGAIKTRVTRGRDVGTTVKYTASH